MTITVSCSISACPKTAKVDTKEYRAASDFVLCHDCEGAVLLDCMLKLEQGTTLEPGFMREFAALYNGWFRRRKGVSLAHRSGVVRSLQDIRDRGQIIVVRGN